ncbi:MAG: nucleotide exchange factor GrpE [Bacteroidota bacterium]
MAKKRRTKKEEAEETKNEEVRIEVEGVENEGVGGEGQAGEGSAAETPSAEDESAAEIARLSTELEGAKKRAQEATEQYLRLMAEFDNFRKRQRRELDAVREYAAESVLTALLPVLDDFDRTLTAMGKTDNLSSVQDGINMVSEKLHRVLEKEGLNPIDAKGQPFDTDLHDAIQSVSIPDEEKKGTVLEVAEKGYRLKDKVIRYSKVIVGE